jgi:hypothetical protein
MKHPKTSHKEIHKQQLRDNHEQMTHHMRQGNVDKAFAHAVRRCQIKDEHIAFNKGIRSKRWGGR